MTATEDRLKALMLGGLDGDATAQRRLLLDLSVVLRRYYQRRLFHDVSEAEDLVQEALIAIHTRRATYDRDQPFTAWVFAVARYKLVDHLRRRRIRPTTPIDDVEDLFAPDESEAATAATDLARLMADLPERQRDAILRTRVEGLSMAEAAARTGQSESAVKVNVHRGLKALMAQFGGGDRHAD